MKKCSVCKIEKNESDFPFHSKLKQTLKTRCKECHKKYSKQHQNLEKKRIRQKEYYIENKTRILARNSEYSKNNREVNRKATKKFKEKAYNNFINYKKTLSCSACGESDYRCLEFHHLNSKKKLDSMSNLYKSTNLFKEELKKCIVLCANCHRKEHFQLQKD